MHFISALLLPLALISGATSLNPPPLVNLGTIIVSDDIPSSNGIPSQNPNCGEDNCIGRVWIYHSTVDTIAQWGTISKSQINNYARTIICRQLGYNNHYEDLENRTPPALNDSIPVWFKNVQCGNHPERMGSYKRNILECSHNVCSVASETGCGDHSVDLIVHCSGKLNTHYDGEAFLCAPKEKPLGMQTTFGMIQINLQDERSIAINNALAVENNFQATRRDTFCRQLGFTRSRVDSVYTKSAMDGRYNFSHCESSSWFDITALKNCEGSSNACFGCCYDYPPNSGSCSLTDCPEKNAALITCVYDPLSEYVQKGSQDLCEKSKIHEGSACNKINGRSANHSQSISLGIFVVVLTVLLLISFGYNIIIIIKKRKRKRNRSDYKELDESGTPSGSGTSTPSES